MKKGDLVYTSEKMKQLAEDIVSSLGRIEGVKLGFSLIVFEFGTHGEANYISNANRTDMISAYKSIVKKLEAELNP